MNQPEKKQQKSIEIKLCKNITPKMLANKDYEKKKKNSEYFVFFNCRHRWQTVQIESGSVNADADRR